MSELDLQRQINDLKAEIRRLDLKEGPGIWVNYYATATIVGWASFTEEHLYYVKSGKILIMQFRITGTSNATNATISLPYTSASGGLTIYNVIRAQDNGGAYVPGLVGYSASATAVGLYPAITGGTWTATGTKSVIGQVVVRLP